MLTISAVGGGKWKYFLSIAKEELLSEEEIEGYWLGAGAEKIGLKGNVKKQHFKNVFEGFAPRNKQIKLVRNAGGADRQGGWDLVFSAPKSVSVAFSQLSDKVPEKKTILEIHHRALEKGIDFLTEQTYTRRFETGVGKSEERAGLVIAAFTHQTSRLNDPLLHTHALFINLCSRADGSTGSINSRQLYVLQKEAGTLYRAELALGLEHHLGLRLHRKESWFEIDGIPDEAIDFFSKRRNEIEARLNKLGFHSAQAKEYANFDTRKAKGYKSRHELFLDWQEQGKALGLSEGLILDLFGKEQIRRDRTEQIQIVVDEVSKRLAQSNKPFTNRDVYRLVAEESQCRGVGLELACSIAKGYLASDDVQMIKEFQKSQLYESKRQEPLIQASQNIDTDRDRDYISHRPIIEIPRASNMGQIEHTLIIQR
ncbi:MAG: relaxase domain-containing protein [Drouetiella hepatica Uher 2000/2452]|jgi:conjugative relaxase-like TrwC/TraI family protein|uniref:Relaxase domain-containing protein n=1 Tax=Drouetiella hepatica Uher 2000/2452 TaxID=904376 RepID=A0A951QCG8_9CYAN|nr:relaxase domain-containing protein [Drouetiella hepatica Uher 2000/2452]